MKILYVSTISNTIKFVIPHIKMLIDNGNIVDVAFNIVRDVDDKIEEMRCKVYNIPFQRNPIKKENLIAYKELKKIIMDEKYDIVHTHTPVASAIVRLVCKNIENIKVIYTAHGFHFYKGAPLRNWIFYYTIEKYLSKYTDILITMNNEDYNIAKYNFFAKKVEYIPGVGLDLERFKNIKVDKKEKRNELGVPEDCFLVLSVGELNKNKNHEIIIKAISKIKNNNIHYIICGGGSLKHYLINISERLCIKDRVHLLGYRKDILEIVKCSDLFAFPSKREGLPVSLMEVMEMKIPVICSKIRGNVDLIHENKGGYLIDGLDIYEYVKKIETLSNMPYENIQKFLEYNKEIIKKYYLEDVLEKMKKIYFDSIEV